MRRAPRPCSDRISRTRYRYRSGRPGLPDRFAAVDRHVDGRGSFRELWRAADFPDARFVQGNLSTSDAGVLRGLHLHRRQDDLWVVASGRAFVALVDVRPMLDRPDGRPVVETRELAADAWVYIPTGVAHGPSVPGVTWNRRSAISNRGDTAPARNNPMTMMATPLASSNARW